MIVIPMGGGPDMERFDKRGMMIIPNPLKSSSDGGEKLIVLGELYCPEGHNLINPQAQFNSHPGIVVDVLKGDNIGMLALSPFYGIKARIAVGIDLESGEQVEMLCPECGCALPVHSRCECGGDLIALFLVAGANFTNCVGVCNRVDCVNSQIISNGKMFELSLDAHG